MATESDFISLYTLPAYSSAQKAYNCIFYCYDCGDNANAADKDCNMIWALGCSTSSYDSCFCRTDAAPLASSFISSCVGTLCETVGVYTTTGPQISQFESIYNDYCNGRLPNSISTTATDSPSTAAPSSTGTVTGPTASVVSTSTSGTGTLSVSLTSQSESLSGSSSSTTLSQNPSTPPSLSSSSTVESLEPTFSTSESDLQTSFTLLC